VELTADTDTVVRPTAWLVPGDLDQILDNLLANALDASPAGGRISVSLTPGENNHFELHVTDEGPGLSRDDRRRAFDRFWRGASNNGGHSGLGLAIVRQLADRNEAGAELRPAGPGGLDAVITLNATTNQSRADV
jgi:signal transduction histidine kinase